MLLNASLVEDRTLFPVRVTPLVTLGASDLRPDGTLKQFTAASAPFIYRGALFPADVRGDAFIADPVGNLVSHQRLRADGLRLQAGRSHPSREFLASTDERFRPVFLESGPEGALYIADMYTGIVEHKRYVTDYLRRQVLGRNVGEFTATGRIYRVVPANHPSGTSRRNLPATPEGWVARLDDADGWMRDTAQRVLVQGAHVAQVPAVRALATDARRSPLGRLHALWTLEGLEALARADIAATSVDPDSRVRAAALRLSERLPPAEQDRLASQLESLAGDASVDVRLQALLTAGTWPAERAWSTLGSILGRADAVEEFGVAAATGLRGRELEFLDRTLPGLAQGLRGPAWPRLLEQLSFNVIVRGQEGEVAGLLERLGNLTPTDPRAEALWRGAGRHKRNGAPLALPARPAVFAQVDSWGEVPAAKEARAAVQHLTWPGDTRFAGKESRPLTGPEQVLFAKGRETYQMLCAACHQVDGMGMAGVAPPLAGSKWVVGNPRIPIEIALRGVAGPIEVNGQIWDMVMPGFAPAPGMSDDETLAALTTYLRRAWGNAASPISPEDAGRIRAIAEGRTQPWTARELEALPAYQTR
jgi:mono/diheme cytochrome c family protein